MRVRSDRYYACNVYSTRYVVVLFRFCRLRSGASFSCWFLVVRCVAGSTGV